MLSLLYCFETENMDEEASLILCHKNQLKKSLEELDPNQYDLDQDLMEEVLNFHQSIPGYDVTPLVRLSCLSEQLGVKGVFIKDESKRFGLKAYKVLGGSYGCLKAVETQLNQLEVHTCTVSLLMCTA